MKVRKKIIITDTPQRHKTIRKDRYGLVILDMAASNAKFVTQIKLLDHLNMMCLEVPKVIVDKLGGFTKERFLCTVNKSVTWQCGFVALKNGSAYISLNKKILNEMNATEGQKVNISLKKDKSKYGMEMSQELKTLLKQDKEGNRRFHLLPLGKQRYIIYYVLLVKGSQRKIDRAIRLIENLKDTRQGKESFKEILANRK